MNNTEISLVLLAPGSGLKPNKCSLRCYLDLSLVAAMPDRSSATILPGRGTKDTDVEESHRHIVDQEESPGGLIDVGSCKVLKQEAKGNKLAVVGVIR